MAKAAPLYTRMAQGEQRKAFQMIQNLARIVQALLVGHSALPRAQQLNEHFERVLNQLGKHVANFFEYKIGEASKDGLAPARIAAHQSAQLVQTGLLVLDGVDLRAVLGAGRAGVLGPGHQVAAADCGVQRFEDVLEGASNMVKVDGEAYVAAQRVAECLIGIDGELIGVRGAKLRRTRPTPPSRSGRCHLARSADRQNRSRSDSHRLTTRLAGISLGITNLLPLGNKLCTMAFSRTFVSLDFSPFMRIMYTQTRRMTDSSAIRDKVVSLDFICCRHNWPKLNQ
ncbi:hypothetical protein BpHYR1_043899 [Brachionus plicatilis]|uniref:Uncharacterized protein n=1 Tax=Brachionus plicatilis TaxID=10195 RepID=A0A3M7SS05_BRAPC|nr:hypothetical protein BpHYR1_043899 [Brachionus plicatilis]